MNTPPKTGWPAPELAQDDHRGLFRWFASKPDARVRVREALPTCCQFHGLEEDGCKGGRECTAGRVTPEDAAGWLLALLVGIVGFVTLGLLAAFVLTNWETLIEQIWPRLVYVASF